VPKSRLSEGVLESVAKMISVTAHAWIDAGLVERNSYGVEVVVAPRPGADFAGATRHCFDADVEGSERPGEWFVDNAAGKNRICEATGMDSHVAIRLVPGSISGLRGAFPWGGAVIDSARGVIVGTSGFHEDEDILFSLAVRHHVAMLLDRDGAGELMAARERELGADATTARFT